MIENLETTPQNLCYDCIGMYLGCIQQIWRSNKLRSVIIYVGDTNINGYYETLVGKQKKWN